MLIFAARALFYLVLSAIIVFVSLLFISNLFVKAPFVPTRKKILPAIEKALKIAGQSVVYDVGCGDGRVLAFCASLHPGAKFIGIEKIKSV